MNASRINGIYKPSGLAQNRAAVLFKVSGTGECLNREPNGRWTISLKEGIAQKNSRALCDCEEREFANPVGAEGWKVLDENGDFVLQEAVCVTRHIKEVKNGNDI